MTRALFPVLAVLILSGCGRAAKVRTAETPAFAPLPIVAEADVPAPVSLTVRVDTGASLGAIAEEAYGHEKFASFVACLNGIPDPEKLAAGAMLKTPALPAAFREAGMDSRYQPSINVLAKAWTDFHAARAGYLEARQTSNAKKMAFVIPDHCRDTFLKCADAIDAANRELEAVKAPHQVPRKTIDQFAQASSQLRQLATGAVDGYGYDSDLVAQRMGLGFANALIWVQEQYR